MMDISFTSLDNIKTIFSGRCKIELLINRNDSHNLLGILTKNLNNNYIKNIYHYSLTQITKSYIEEYHYMYIQENEEFVKNYKHNPNYFNSAYYIIKLISSDEIVGQVNIIDKGQLCVELVLFIDNKHSKQGYGTEVALSIIDMLQHNSNIKKIKWSCNSACLVAAKIASKCGFVYSHSYNIDENTKFDIYYKNLFDQKV